MSKNKPHKILFLISGSIACYKSAHVISRLQQAGFDIEIVATRAALEFVGAATLEGLIGKKIHTETFAPGSYMDHIHLMKWSDLVILCPATANTLNKMAAGVGDDLLSTLFLAYDFKKPFLVAPAMNTNMYKHPSTQSSMDRLKEWGIQFLLPDSGFLACGDIGEGRLLEPEKILEAVFSVTSKTLHSDNTEKSKTSQTDSTNEDSTTKRSLKILITSGGTEEPIDGVRSISNFSTGRTGAVLADTWIQEGHSVGFLTAKHGARPILKKGSMQNQLLIEEFVSTNDLDKLLQKNLANDWDVLVHLAAVSDYSVESVSDESGKTYATDNKQKGKISSQADSLNIKLKRNPKLINKVRQLSKNQSLILVGFKLTHHSSKDQQETKANEVLKNSKANFVVQNELSEISESGHRTRIFSTHGLEAELDTKEQLAYTLESLFLKNKGDHT